MTALYSASLLENQAADMRNDISPGHIINKLGRPDVFLSVNAFETFTHLNKIKLIQDTRPLKQS